MSDFDRAATERRFMAAMRFDTGEGSLTAAHAEFRAALAELDGLSVEAMGRPGVLTRELLGQILQERTDAQRTAAEATADRDRLAAENARLRAALQQTLVFSEFSDEWHDMDNSEVVEFRRLRTLALTPETALHSIAALHMIAGGCTR